MKQKVLGIKVIVSCLCLIFAQKTQAELTNPGSKPKRNHDNTIQQQIMRPKIGAPDLAWIHFPAKSSSLPTEPLSFTRKKDQSFRKIIISRQKFYAEYKRLRTTRPVAGYVFSSSGVLLRTIPKRLSPDEFLKIQEQDFKWRHFQRNAVVEQRPQEALFWARQFYLSNLSFLCQKILKQNPIPEAKKLRQLCQENPR